MGVRKKENKTKNKIVFEGYAYYYDNGKRRQVTKRGFKTYKEAKSWVTETEYKIKNSQLLKNNASLTLMEVFSEFLIIGSVQYQPNTIYNTKKDIHYFKNEIGNLKISEIDYLVLQKFFNSRQFEGIETNKNIKKSLNRIFKYALKCHYISENPLQYVVITGVVNSKQKNILNFDDFIKLTNQIKEKHDFHFLSYAIAVQIGYYTGLRISEVTALTKNDFDLVNNEITINKKLVFKGLRKNEYYSTDKMKSKSSQAVIPLTKPLKDIVIDWFKLNPFEIVVCDENGCYINPTCCTNLLRREAAKLGIKFNYHMLRHTYATTLIENNVDVKVAQELLRHNNYNTTLSIYTHVETNRKKRIVDEVFG